MKALFDKDRLYQFGPGMKKLSNVVFVGWILSLAACSSSNDFAELKAQLKEIRERPSGNVDPTPPTQIHENFIYSATLTRSPFEPPIVVVEKQETPVIVGNVKPDPLRRREILEQFSLESLSMVGTIQRSDQGLYALLKDKKAVVYRILPGNYIGKNHGRVTGIAPNKIDLVEIVKNGSSGWIERPRTITLKDN